MKSIDLGLALAILLGCGRGSGKPVSQVDRIEAAQKAKTSLDERRKQIPKNVSPQTRTFIEAQLRKEERELEDVVQQRAILD